MQLFDNSNKEMFIRYCVAIFLHYAYLIIAQSTNAFKKIGSSNNGLYLTFISMQARKLPFVLEHARFFVP